MIFTLIRYALLYTYTLWIQKQRFLCLKNIYIYLSIHTHRHTYNSLIKLSICASEKHKYSTRKWFQLKLLVLCPYLLEFLSPRGVFSPGTIWFKSHRLKARYMSELESLIELRDIITIICKIRHKSWSWKILSQIFITTKVHMT